MAVHALMEVEVAPGQARRALWTAARLARRLAARPGFRGLRVYRSERSAETLLVLTEWSEWNAAVAAESEAPVAMLLAQVRSACARWDNRRLEPLFHLQLPRRKPCAGLAQTLRAGALPAGVTPAQQKEFGLKAMSLPGTVGVLGGRCSRDPSFFFCALEFDTDTTMADFAGSATRHEWARRGGSSWWHKESRLERRAHPATRAGGETERRSERLGNLSVQIESSPDGAVVILRLHGCLDDAAAERFVRVRKALVACGCRDLTLDVSQLTAATTEGLKVLVATARQIKNGGGQFTLADNQGRYHQILRAWRLNQALASEGEAASPRKVASLRLRTPGSA
jgi:anti-anti-sigma factor